MANELNIAYTAGATLEAAIYSPGWSQLGSNISMTEASSGLYTASVPGAPAAGCYGVLFIDTAGPSIIGRGELVWDGSAEVCDASESEKLKELWQLRGLDSANPTTFRPDKIFVGAEGAPELEVILDGNGINESKATRTP
jgi:hypothetical protein